MRLNARRLQLGLVLVVAAAAACVPAAAVFFTPIAPVGSWTVGGQSFNYGGHITWLSEVDFDDNQTFRTETHGTTTCGWTSCTGSGASAQAWCTRTAGLGAYGEGHKVESLLLKNDVVVSSRSHVHDHPSGDHNVPNAKHQALVNISVYPVGTVTWKFKVTWYNSNGEAEEGMTETL